VNVPSVPGFSRFPSVTMLTVKHIVRNFACATVFLPIVLSAQSVPAGIRSVCADGRVIEAFNPTGWTVPGIAETETKTPRAEWGGTTSPTLTKSEKVYLAILKSKAREGSFALVSCMEEKSAQARVRQQEVDIDYDIWRFEMNGTVFAYRVIGGWASGRGSERVRIGTATTLLFYDPDGCGQFKMMRYSDSDRSFELIVPDWVRGFKPKCTP